MENVSKLRQERIEKMQKIREGKPNNGKPFSEIKDSKSDKVKTKTIDLPSSVVIKEIPAFKVTASSIELIDIKDDAANKKIIAKTANAGNITLWEGSDYDKVGQWTDDDVHARLIQLFVK